MRISIIGHPGSGKTWLAVTISERFGIPHIHIDRFWFEAGGADVDYKTSEEKKEKVRAYIREKVREAIAPESWVSDGFYSRVQPEIVERADVVLYLDLPLWRRLLNHAKRLLKPSQRHSEVSLWDDILFLWDIIRRKFAFEWKYKQFLEQYKDKIVTLRSRKEIEKYLGELALREEKNGIR